MHVAPVAGTHLHYRLDGEPGAPVVLLSNSLGTTLDMWEPQAALLAQRYCVVRYDTRGHGQSDVPPGPYAMDVLGRDAVALLDHLGIARADVMGYSMGARISAFLALAHPERVRSLVFGGLGLNMVRGVAGTGPVAKALEADSIDDVSNPTARTFRAFAEQTRSDLKALAACIRSARAPITVEDVGRLSCPVLVAVGSEDVVGGSGRDLAALIPGARALDITGRDHMRAVGDKIYKEGVLEFLKTRP